MRHSREDSHQLEKAAGGLYSPMEVGQVQTMTVSWYFEATCHEIRIF